MKTMTSAILQAGILSALLVTNSYADTTNVEPDYAIQQAEEVSFQQALVSEQQVFIAADLWNINQLSPQEKQALIAKQKLISEAQPLINQRVQDLSQANNIGSANNYLISSTLLHAQLLGKSLNDANVLFRILDSGITSTGHSAQLNNCILSGQSYINPATSKMVITFSKLSCVRHAQIINSCVNGFVSDANSLNGLKGLSPRSITPNTVVSVVLLGGQS